MDKIWVENPSKSEVIGRCGGDEKTEWPRRTDKSQTLKNEHKTVEDLFSFFLESKYLKLIFVDIVCFCKAVKSTSMSASQIFSILLYMNYVIVLYMCI